MLHTLAVKVVTCQLPNQLPVPHKVYQFSRDLLTCQGIKDIGKHTDAVITADINTLKEQDPKFNDALFTVYDMATEEVKYIG